MVWMEACAFISAGRLCFGQRHIVRLVTASVDRLHFVQPTRVGDIVYFTSEVTATFGSSAEVMVSVDVEDPSTGALRHCNDAWLYVAHLRAA